MRPELLGPLMVSQRGRRTLLMADPELPEVRAEMMREDRPDAHADYASMNVLKYMWAGFAIAVVAIIAFAIFGAQAF
jgi:hypothetical protein